MPPVTRKRTTLLLAFCTVACWAVQLHGSERHVLRIDSPSMDRRLRVTVFLPESHERTDRSYPVIYLLHGYGGNHRTWSALVPLGRYADTYEAIFVCPDGGRASWYLDSPVRTDSRFETFIVDDVVSAVDTCYRVAARALIGSSMGGHGALTILARHPDLFMGAGSIAGVMDLASVAGNWGTTEILGPYSGNERLWRGHSFVGLAERLTGKGKALILECGSSDPAVEGNRQAHALLQQLGIEHEYRERAGRHTPQFVAASVEHHIATLAKACSEAARQ